MAGGVLIRPFHPDDVAGVAGVIVPIQQDEFGINITYEDQPDLKDIPAYYVQEAGGFWVAIADNAVVGCVALKDIGDNQGALRKMFVQRAYRGKQFGIAAALLETLINHATMNGMDDVFLGTTTKFIAAHHFYEKNGFDRIDEIDLPHRFPHMDVDTRFYHRAISRTSI